MIDRNHPAVEAAARTALAGGWTCDTHEPEPWGECRDCTDSHLRSAPRALAAALPHLTADDLRDTPAGRELMAEAWEEGAQAAWGASGEGWNGEYAGRPGPVGVFRAQNPAFPNPYKETPNE